MKLCCRASSLTEVERDKMVNQLEALGCHPEVEETAVEVNYEGSMDNHALAIIVAVEAAGCHFVTMVNGGKNG